MRVVFCGNPEFALPTLTALLDSRHEVVAAVTSPDQPQGRGRLLAPMPVKRFALDRGLRVLSPPKLKDPEFVSDLRQLRPDVLVVVAFRILPREVFSLPKWGALNVHPSLLPKCRGPAPIQWTLLRGETMTGVTIIRLTEEIDGGGMLAQEATGIDEHENFGDLHNRLATMGADMLVRVLDRLSSEGSIIPIQQDESLVTTARKLKPEDYVLDFRLSAVEILNKIRAFSPAPAAVARFRDYAIKILLAEIASSTTPLSASQVLYNQDSLIVGTGDHPISLKTVKPAGKREMPIKDYLRGRPSLPDRFE